MSDILEKIKAYKIEEINQRRAEASEADLLGRIDDSDPVRPFAQSLRDKVADGYGLIAEIKKASPSKGLIRADFDPESHAKAYEAAGAACLSVLTDGPSFQGHEDFLKSARAATEIPVLRKDFMFDPYQVVESRAMGADCILVIMAALDTTQAAEIEAAAFEHGMDVLIEVHSEAETETALKSMKSRLIGVNNRDLRSFETDVKTTARILPIIPEGYEIVSESGLNTRDDLRMVAEWGVRRFLIGESLMRQNDVEAATRDLLAQPFRGHI